jgi:hypothetical protein
MAKAIKLSDNIYNEIQSLALNENKKLVDIVTVSIMEYKKKRLMEQMDKAFEVINNDINLKAEYEKEEKELENTLPDELNLEDWSYLKE